MVARISMPRPSRPPVAAIPTLVLVVACAVGLTLADTTPLHAQQPSGNPADVQFMSGMIIHHEQAVLMAGWAPTHGAGPAVARLCRKISVSQRDDIDLMKRWLQEHGHSIPDTSWVFDYEGSGMRTHKLMAGMLTADRLAALDAARGEEFDRLFLEGMIGHHAGAVTMVKNLLASPGGAQDNFVFEFATDINSSQTVEIHLMQRMLVALPADATKP
jgi:uncharacterized protein (DUF305 family)